MGVTLIPEMALAVETRSAPVAVARLPPPRPMRTVGMVWRRASPLGDQLALIAQAVRDAATTARDPGASAEDMTIGSR
jgi:LysR family hydrogen peroxide-inducible transcriptional activator